MYKSVKVVNQIKSYSAKNSLAIKDGRIIDLIRNEYVLDRFSNLFRIYSFGKDLIIVSDIRGNSFVIKNDELINRNSLKINSFYYPYIQYYSDDEPRKYFVIDIRSLNLKLKSNEWIGQDILGHYIFDKQNRTIVCREIEKLESLWNYKLISLGSFLSSKGENKRYEVKSFIGINKGKLIIQLNNATFLILNINSGQQEQIINLNLDFPLPQGLFYNDNHAAHLFENKLIWLSNQRLLEIDLDTFNVHVIKDYFHESRENQFRFMSNSFHNGSVYFVADIGWQYVTPSHVGVMNPNTGAILWSQQLENTGGLAEAPQATEDKLYIRTNKGVLHIFEKEEL